MQNVLPPEIQTPKPLGNRQQIFILACVLVLAIGGISIWYFQFRELRIPFVVENYFVDENTIARLQKLRKKQHTTSPLTSLFRQAEVDKEEFTALLRKNDRAESLGKWKHNTITETPSHRNWYGYQEGKAAINISGTFAAQRTKGTDTLKFEFDVELAIGHPHQPVEEWEEQVAKIHPPEPPLPPRPFRGDASYEGNVPSGVLLFIKKIDDDSYQIITFDPED